MNETMKTILERNTCRDFSGKPLSDESVQQLIQAALASPSAMNKMPWHIIVVTDKTLIDEMDTIAMEAIKSNEAMYNRMKERGGKMYYNAPCMMIIAGDGSDYAQLDGGIVSQNIALAAHSLGLGSCICGMARIPLASEQGATLKQRLQFPEGYDFVMSVLVGHVNTGKAPHEMDYNKITTIKGA